MKDAHTIIQERIDEHLKEILELDNSEQSFLHGKIIREHYNMIKELTLVLERIKKETV